MNNFLKTGIYTDGCIVPVTTEDPAIWLILDKHCEDFRLNVYVGNTWIDQITMVNHRTLHNDVSRLPVHSYEGEYLGTVNSLVEEQVFFDLLKIHHS